MSYWTRRLSVMLTSDSWRREKENWVHTAWVRCIGDFVGFDPLWFAADRGSALALEMSKMRCAWISRQKISGFSDRNPNFFFFFKYSNNYDIFNHTGGRRSAHTDTMKMGLKLWMQLLISVFISSENIWTFMHGPDHHLTVTGWRCHWPMISVRE